MGRIRLNEDQEHKFRGTVQSSVCTLVVCLLPDSCMVEDPWDASIGTNPPLSKRFSRYFRAGPKLERGRRDPSRSLIIRLLCCLLLFALSFVLFFIPYAFSSSPSFLLSSSSSSSSFLSSSSSPLPRPRNHSRNSSSSSSSSFLASSTASPLVPPLFSPSLADDAVIVVVSGSWLLHGWALWRRRVRANLVRLKARADFCLAAAYATILFPQSILGTIRAELCALCSLKALST